MSDETTDTTGDGTTDPGTTESTDPTDGSSTETGATDGSSTETGATDTSRTANDEGVHVAFDRSRAEFCELVADERPAVVRVAATLATAVEPVTAYAVLSDRSPYSFLLESAEKVASFDPDGAFTPDGAGDAGRHARFSFVGYDPAAVVSVWPDETTVDARGPAADYVERGLASLDDARGSSDTASDDPTSDGRVGERRPDALAVLRAAMPDVTRVGFPETDRQTLDGGFVGFLSYDAVYDLTLNEVGVERTEPASVPDAQFLLTTRTLVFDDRDDSVRLVCTPVVGPDDDPGVVYDELRREARDVAATLADARPPEPDGIVRHGETAGSRAAYEAAVETTKDHVLEGDVYQGVISRSRRLAGEVDPLGLYESLREVNPSPYMYLLSHGDRSVVGASPETLVSVRDDRVVVNPVAGTCPRGDSPVEDRRLAGEMLADEKEQAEHTMLVDLARNDVRRVARSGSVRVEEFMHILKYSHVQHIESTVTGRLAPDADAFDATRATFPRGTLTGAPKVRAMEIIDTLESTPRGVYGGGVGYYSWTGDADLAIVIRTAVVDHDRSPDDLRVDGAFDRPLDELTVRAGAGIVADSDPTAEYEETEQKMAGVLDAVERIERDSETRDRDHRVEQGEDS